MISTRKFHRTLITVEVLSEGSYPVPFTLQQVGYDITFGDCVGRILESEIQEVDAPKMVELLQECASEPEFFQLDEEGNDIDNDLYEEEEEGEEG